MWANSIGFQVTFRNKRNFKRAVFDGLKERIWRKTQSWSYKRFSQESRVVMIKAILQAILPCAMSCFKIPNTVLHEIKVILATFFGTKIREGKSIGMT
ncbi:UNVERIFIED_CONTAM: hypothetical protein Slati_2949100 [Sesamum latifolium]|uniref:Reverse transcriptase n=1 Tax=Sesamum latifolium TaxID=2727402 RepID=A0AAW2VF28_9LAMI